MRTLKQTSEIIEKTITEIRKHDRITNEKLTGICMKNGIAESIIRKVGGWPYKEK